MKFKYVIHFSLFAFLAFIISLPVAGLVLYKDNPSSKTQERNQLNKDVDLGVGEKVVALSMDIVSTHNTEDDCWMVIDDNVYSVADYIAFHPGGTETIIPLCGQEASEAFHTKGGRGNDHLPTTTTLLQTYFISELGGEIVIEDPNGFTNGDGKNRAENQFGQSEDSISPQNTTNQGTASNSLTAASVAEHKIAGDCWGIIGSNVYNLTSYIPFHPGGTNPITSLCGGNMTQAFNTKGGIGNGHSSYAQSLLKNYYVGSVGGTNALSSGTTNGVVVPTLAQPTIAPVQQSNGITASTVASHSTQGDCWMIYNSKVYNITSYIPFHPGGTNAITPWCGKDGTNAFNTKGSIGNSHSSGAKNLLNNYYVGDLSGSTNSSGNSNTNQSQPTVSQPTTTTAPSVPSGVSLTTSEIANHSSENDCWSIYNGKVYNITAYIPFHPGGKNVIIPECGGDMTQAFNTKGGKGGSHSGGAINTLNNYYIGDVNGTASSSGSSGGTDTTGGDSGTYSTPEEAIRAAYPGATITKVSYEDDGRKEVKFLWNGEDYEAKLDSQNNITEVGD